MCLILFESEKRIGFTGVYNIHVLFLGLCPTYVTLRELLTRSFF